MVIIEKQIEHLIKKAIYKIKPDFLDTNNLFIQRISNSSFGDFQTNFSMINAKYFNDNPKNIAKNIIENIPENNLIEKAQIAGPGFINFFLKQTFVENILKSTNINEFSYDFLDRKGKVIIDYSSPNIAKRMHIGHLRSTVIGDAIKRIYKFLGYSVIADNHIGDWGTQYGKLIIGYKNWLDKKLYKKKPIEELERIYVEFDKKSQTNPELEEQARFELTKLQNGEKENNNLWKEFVDVSLKEYKKIYKRLYINFDTYYGESFYHNRMAPIVELLKEKKIASLDNGAYVVFFDEKENLHPCIIQKKDGAFLYASSDLATLQFKLENYDVNQAIYITDERQQTHFKQVFKIADLLGWKIKKIHLRFGIMRFTDGIFSTRKGNVIKLEDLLNESVKRVTSIINEKNPNLPEDEKKDIAEIVGVGAIKYADLSQNKHSTIIFDWDKTLSFEGNTSPYLQYTYARINSILKKAKKMNYEIDKKNILLSSEIEKQLATFLLYMPNEIVKAGINYKPNLITDYLFELAQKFNSFYNAVPILKGEDKVYVKSRLALIHCVAEWIKTGLDILGIKVVERM